jgi:hypothetical protein
MTAMSSGECPHCGERIENVAALDRHLAERHYLRTPDAGVPPTPAPWPPPRPDLRMATILEGIVWLGLAAFSLLLWLGVIPIEWFLIAIGASVLWYLSLEYRRRQR